MSGERGRVALDPAYATALGEALYCFALCEWNAVYCIQKHEPNYVVDAFRPTQPTMAGTIAEKLRSVVNRLPESASKQEWAKAAQTFSDLVKTERNRLVHAKPGTNTLGEQRLFYFDFEWTIEAVQNVSDRFARCSGILHTLLYEP